MADYYVDLNATESEIKSITSDLADIVREKSNDGKVVGIQKKENSLNKLIAKPEQEIDVNKQEIPFGNGKKWVTKSGWYTDKIERHPGDSVEADSEGYKQPTFSIHYYYRTYPNTYASLNFTSIKMDDEELWANDEKKSLYFDTKTYGTFLFKPKYKTDQEHTFTFTRTDSILSYIQIEEIYPNEKNNVKFLWTDEKEFSFSTSQLVDNTATIGHTNNGTIKITDQPLYSNEPNESKLLSISDHGKEYIGGNHLTAKDGNTRFTMHDKAEVDLDGGCNANCGPKIYLHGDSFITIQDTNKSQKGGTLWFSGSFSKTFHNKEEAKRWFEGKGFSIQTYELEQGQSYTFSSYAVEKDGKLFTKDDIINLYKETGGMQSITVSDEYVTKIISTIEFANLDNTKFGGHLFTPVKDTIKITFLDISRRWISGIPNAYIFSGVFNFAYSTTDLLTYNTTIYPSLASYIFNQRQGWIASLNITSPEIHIQGAPLIIIDGAPLISVTGYPNIHIQGQSQIIFEENCLFGIKDRAYVIFEENSAFFVKNEASVIFQCNAQIVIGGNNGFGSGFSNSSLPQNSKTAVVITDDTTIQITHDYQDKTSNFYNSSSIQIHGATIIMDTHPTLMMHDYSSIKMTGNANITMQSSQQNITTDVNSEEIYAPVISMTNGSKIILNGNNSESPVIFFDPSQLKFIGKAGKGTYNQTEYPWTGHNEIPPFEAKDENPFISIAGTSIINMTCGASNPGRNIVSIQSDNGKDLHVYLQNGCFIQHTGDSHEEIHDTSTFVMRGKQENKKPWEDGIDYDQEKHQWVRPFQIRDNSPLLSLYDEAGFIMRGKYNYTESETEPPEWWKPHVAKKKDSPLAELIDNVELRLGGNFKCKTKNVTKNDNKTEIQIIISDNTNNSEEDDEEDTENSVSFTLSELKELKKLISTS